MLYVHLETVEEIFDTIETIVTKIRESNKDKLVTILVDSLNKSTKQEMDTDFDKDGWKRVTLSLSQKHEKDYSDDMTEKVALVFTNQLRQKVRCNVWRPGLQVVVKNLSIPFINSC